MSGLHEQLDSAPVQAAPRVPFGPVDYINRAVAHVEMQRFYGALADFGQAIRFGPNNAVVFYNRGVV
jgi:hypothetical protein